MTEERNKMSYFNADIGETYGENPRVISSHLRITYSRLIHLADQLDFNSPIFAGMMKRNRSLGSVQALIVELAFSNRQFMEENILPFCMNDGENVILDNHYQDRIYFDRLEAYSAKSKRTIVEPAIEKPKQRKIKRSYF